MLDAVPSGQETDKKRGHMNILRKMIAAGANALFRGAQTKGIVASTLILLSSSAIAGSSAGYGMGGQFTRFDPVVSQYNQSGELFRILGHCQSACTLFLGIRNVCIERSARLLFHAGNDRSGRISATSTQHMLSAYKPRLRQYLVSGGHTQTQAFHAVSGADLIARFGYKPCP